MTAIFSLTPRGRLLAARIASLVENPRLFHRASPFGDEVRKHFRRGEPLVLICASGIAVRVLAPVVTDKTEDPPVLLLDEDGLYLIPLLSCHEGGANGWGVKLAAALGANCVQTTAGPYGDSYVVGLGCERGAALADLEGAVEASLRGAGIERKQLVGLATIDLKRTETAFVEFADKLSLPLDFFAAEVLRQFDGRLINPSAEVERCVGCRGVAEAAALSACERLSPARAELVSPKRIFKAITVAIARVGQPHSPS